jgi:hypothetical protein
MQRSSETIGAIAGRSPRPRSSSQPREIADRDHPIALPAGSRPDLPLRLARQRA